MAKTLKNALREYLRIDGLKAAAMIGRDGFLIESALLGDMDLEGLGAFVATAIGSSEMMGKDLQLGELQVYLLEFEMGRVVIASAGAEILVLVAEPDAMIGSVRRAAMKGLSNVLRLL